MHAAIMNISRLRMATDGAGVSTLVAFYGCPLHCRYCINDHCHEKGDREDSPKHDFWSPEALVNILQKDDLYYKMTGGGIVFGGGEPLLQAEFIHEACRLSDPKWAKRIETSLHAEWDMISILTDDIDEWIIDIKDSDDTIYRNYTGNSNKIVFRNLSLLKERVPASRIWIRIPHIPRYNRAEDVLRTKKVLEEMGFSHLEEFTYLCSGFARKREKTIRNREEVRLTGISFREDHTVPEGTKITIPDFLKKRASSK